MGDQTIHFACDACDKRYSTPRENAGRTTKCAKCGAPIVVPTVSTRLDPLTELIGFACELCGTRMNVPPRYVGRKVKCPDCDHATVVPAPEEKQPKQRPAAMEGEQYEVYEGEQPRGVDLARASPKSISFECRLCQTHLQAPATAVGAQVACPDCGVKTRVPPPPKPQAKVSLAVDDYEVDEIEPATTGEGLFEQYVSKPPAGFRHLAAKSSDRSERPRAGLETSIEAPRWGVGIASGLVSCFASTNMLLALLGLSFGLMFTLPMAGFTAGLFAAIGLVGFVFGFMLLVFAFAITLTWLGVFAAIYWATLSDSAAGARRVENWPTVDPGEWIGPAFYVVIGNVVASIPGAALASLVGYWRPDLAVLAGSVGAWVALPIIQLSQLDNNSVWGVVSTNVLRTLWHAPVTWLAFYVGTLGVLLIYLEVLDLTVEHAGPWGVLIMSPATVLSSIVYAWMLGRAGWAAGAATPQSDPPSDP